jgi:hypothetical protein
MTNPNLPWSLNSPPNPQTLTCPLCGKSSPAPILVSYKDLVWRKCSQCSFGFLFPYVSEEAQALQKKSSPSTLGHEDNNPETTYANYLKSAHLFSEVAEEKSQWIQNYLRSLPDPSSAVVIEIGPGLGLVLKKLRERMPQQVLVAVESQPRFSEHLKESGFPVLEDVKLLGNHPLVDKKHVVVFMDNVLEHIAHPSEFLKELKFILLRDDSQRPHKNSEGPIKTSSLSLLVEVPNEFGIEAKGKLQDFIRGFRKPPTFPGHINLFTKQTLKQCVQAAGFTNFKISQQSIRSVSQVQYLSQSTKVSPLARAVVKGLNIIPADRILGLSYWLRVEAILKNQQVQR